MSLEHDEFTMEFISTLVRGLSKEDFKEAEKRLEAANKKFLDYLHIFREDITIEQQRLVATVNWNEDEQEQKFNQGLENANGTND